MSEEQRTLEDEAMARRLQEEEDERMAQSLASTQISDNHNYSQPTQQHYEPDHKRSPPPSSSPFGAPPPSAAFASPMNNSYAPPPPPTSGFVPVSSRQTGDNGPVQMYAPPSSLPPPPTSQESNPPPPVTTPHHTNRLIQVSALRAKDEQKMQNWLQTLQYQYGIYNPELEPEHEADYVCFCPIHQYQQAKWSRSQVQDLWNEAVLYPGEKAYNSNKPYNTSLFSGNPYQYKTISPYFGTFNMGTYGPKRANASSHAKWTAQVIALNDQLNRQAQTAIDAKEPKANIWGEKEKMSGAFNQGPGDKKGAQGLSNGTSEKKGGSNGFPAEKSSANGHSNGHANGSSEKAGLSSEKSSSNGVKGAPPPPASSGPPQTTVAKPEKHSKFASFRKSVGLKTSSEREAARVDKDINHGSKLRQEILEEENGRWPTPEWREIVRVYQEKTGMAGKIAFVRTCQPIQYLHLLRAGYFEPIPVAWANQASNPLKFSIESTSGWRGITPSWRGYEDTAEERLYWVLNHREGSTGTRLKPDFISALNLARERMERAVPPPPEYYDPSDTCHTQHKTDGYSKQVMPPPFKAFDRPETSADDTMILLDVSGSMDFVPQRPRYDRYLVTGYDNTNQPKNKDLAKAIIRRFVDAMSNHDHNFTGYDLTTFSSSARYIGTINGQNLDALWSTIKIQGGTRVMTGWQKVKELHFQKHSESAIHHPIYGWQAGPDTPILRLLLLLDGEATDMDEFELDLLGLSWAHVTIFLIGVDGCPHHHRHANELQRISDVNHHVSFVDAQGNTPERYVTHELLKRHLGYEVTMAEFQDMEVPPTYQEATF